MATKTSFIYIYFKGLTDADNEGNWTWTDGTPFNSSLFNYWRSKQGEPNNYNGNEDCAEITFDGRWNDNNCDVQFGFICKRGISKHNIFNF